MALNERGLRVVVLADAWPSLRRQYRALSLDRWLSGLVISAEQGISKPDPRAFQNALQMTGSAPSETLFVDDGEVVRAAIALGLQGVRLRHLGEAHAPGLEEVFDLRDILHLLVNLMAQPRERVLRWDGCPNVRDLNVPDPLPAVNGLLAATAGSRL